jgi:outer membrane receptor protein involved in Fe transport
MKSSIFIERLQGSQSFTFVQPKYHPRSSYRVALLASLVLTLTTLGWPGYIEAQEQQTQTQQTQPQQTSDANRATSPDVPTPNAPETPKPDAIDIPVLKTSINVTDSISDISPASISVLSNKALETDPGVSLDDQLRIIPGFSLLRRTSGVVASATTQGVSLRGLGLAGPSRTLVLWDGIPLNDPYGGWINWTRVSPENVSEVDVARGATSSIFGNLAMSGTVTLFSRPEEKNLIDLSQEGGTQGTLMSHGTYSWLGKNVGFSLDGRGYITDGYYVVPSVLRGPVDAHAFNRFVAGSPRFDWFEGENRFFFKADVLEEYRKLGTLIPQESTSLGEFSGHYSREMRHDTFSIVGYYEKEDWSAKYSTINQPRTVETLVDIQYVPSQGAGGAVYWEHFHTNWHLTAGTDVEYASGFSHDYSPFTHATTIKGGDLVQTGLFTQAAYQIGPVQLSGGIRYQFTDAQNNITAPNGGITYTKGIFRLRGALNRSFRVPTLNELYRPYQQGNILTLANPLLTPETMDGGEIGFDLNGKTRRLSITAFRNSITNFIEQPNVGMQGNEIIRKRENVGDGINEGFEADVQQRWGRWLGTISYLYADTRLTSGPLDGLWVPGVPRNQGTAQLTWVRNGTMLSAGFRAYSYQFDDQQNQFVDPGYALLQFAGTQHLWRQLSANFDIENALDRYYVVGYFPIVNKGEPFTFRVGLRWNGVAR